MYRNTNVSKHLDQEPFDFSLASESPAIFCVSFKFARFSIEPAYKKVCYLLKTWSKDPPMLAKSLALIVLRYSNLVHKLHLAHIFHVTCTISKDPRPAFSIWSKKLQIGKNPARPPHPGHGFEDNPSQNQNKWTNSSIGRVFGRKSD